MDVEGYEARLRKRVGEVEKETQKKTPTEAHTSPFLEVEMF